MRLTVFQLSKALRKRTCHSCRKSIIKDTIITTVPYHLSRICRDVSVSYCPECSVRLLTTQVKFFEHAVLTHKALLTRMKKYLKSNDYKTIKFLNQL